MKRIFIVFIAISALLAICLVPIGSEAAEESGYVIGTEGGEAVLSSSGTVLGRGSIGELLKTVPDNSRITFKGAEVRSSFEIPSGSYVFSGELEVLSGTIAVREGANILLSDIKIDSTDNPSVLFNVSGGSLRIVSSEISCSGVAVLSDYSQGSTTVLEDASIRCSSTEGAIRLISGSLSVKSGSIKNTLGVAFESRGALTLCKDPEISGVPTDIITDRAISLSTAGDVYDARYALRVSFDGVFSEGGSYEIFSKAKEESIGRISLYDKNGKSYPLTYFGEKSTAAVYLPHTLKFTDGVKEISTV